ncbi:MAG: cytochrome d ubiquinol oxidase subunit II, partial [Alphaproteobacteria bacterium]|nr:cytochrome d ubiquinol oxidase subunit II [Alphaproteobacteria bacterium]
WLVLGGGGLFAVFPKAYGILMPAFYLPIMFMLLGLILRGISFEFRFKGTLQHRRIWDISFHVGSLLAAFMQGVILGGFIQGINVKDTHFAGGPWDWVSGFNIITGLSLIFGYTLLGATWLIMKTEGITQKWARRVAGYVKYYVALAMIVISLATPFVDPRIMKLWFSMPNIFYLAPIPLLTFMGFVKLWLDLQSHKEYSPFLLTIGLFFLGYLGLGISLYPWIVPFELTLWQAAAAPQSQSILLIGTVFLLPIILFYTGYVYYVFRGKSCHEPLYK